MHPLAPHYSLPNREGLTLDMKDIEYGCIRLKLKDVMKEQNISINRLSCRAEMQRTQLKAYINGNIQRIDLAVMARLCYVLECELSDLIEYVPPQS